MLKNYATFVCGILEEVYETQFPKLVEIGELILDKVSQGGQFMFFGSGHGHILSEEMLDKVGGFSFPKICNPMDLYGHPLKAGFVERNYEFGEVFYEMLQLKENDVLWLISNSGTNGVVVELAKRSKENGITLITHTNMKQSVKVSPRHPSGKKMFEYADYVINNCGEDGDAAFESVPGHKQGATSNCVGTFILQGLNVVFAKLLSDADCNEEDLFNGQYQKQKKVNKEAIIACLKVYKDYYFDNLDRVIKTQFEPIHAAAKLSAEAILSENRNYMFGMVHDHSLVEEIHSRAGTIMCNRSIVMTNQDIQLYEGIKKATMYANIAKYADAVLYSLEPKANDTFLCVSQSSNEPAMIHFIELLKEKGCKVILHTNCRYADTLNPDSIYKKVDVVIDNCCAPNQTGLQIGKFAIGAIETSIGCFINQCYVMSMTKYLHEHGYAIPTRISINTDKGLIYTEDLNRKFFNGTII